MKVLLEEYGPRIVYIECIHNTVADAISRLKYDPSINKTAENYHMTKKEKELNKLSETKLDDSLKTMVQSKNRHRQTQSFKLLFANHGEEDKIYPLTTIEMAEAQRKDQEL
jgi:hypothetical protein